MSQHKLIIIIIAHVIIVIVIFFTVIICGDGQYREPCALQHFRCNIHGSYGSLWLLEVVVTCCTLYYVIRALTSVYFCIHYFCIAVLLVLLLYLYFAVVIINMNVNRFTIIVIVSVVIDNVGVSIVVGGGVSSNSSRVLPTYSMCSLIIMQMPTEMHVHANLIEYVYVISESVLVELARL